MLTDKVTGTVNNVVQELYITISVHKKNVEEARTFFGRVTNDVIAKLTQLDAHSEELDATQRLQELHDFYRPGEEAEFRFHLKEHMKSGRSFKDCVCPDSMEMHKDYFVMGTQYGRVLFLKEFASYIKDSMITELTELNRGLMLSIDIIPVPTDEAVREMQNRLLGVETNVANWQRRQNNSNNFSAVVPYDLEQQRKETREMLDDLTTRDQRMLFGLVTLVHLADSKEKLDSDTETLQSIARKHLCQLSTLTWQQPEGLVTALPYGLRKVDALRTLTTEVLAVLMPFKAQEIHHQGGIYYGQNVISKNLILANRMELLNGNGFILGVSGSGKSFTAKREITSLALSTKDDIIIIDPESEYRPLVEGLGGEVISISATSPNHINALDMEQGYGGGENPVVLKSEFLLSLCEQLVGSGKLNAKEKSIIDRCTASVYREYIRSGYQGKMPTLRDFYTELLLQPEPEARDVALKEKTKPVPRELVRRGAGRAAAELKSQLREAAEDGQYRDDYGGDHLTDTAEAAVKRAGQAGGRFAWQKANAAKERAFYREDAEPGAEPAQTQGTPTVKTKDSYIQQQPAATQKTLQSIERTGESHAATQGRAMATKQAQVRRAQCPREPVSNLSNATNYPSRRAIPAGRFPVQESSPAKEIRQKPLAGKHINRQTVKTSGKTAGGASKLASTFRNTYAARYLPSAKAVQHGIQSLRGGAKPIEAAAKSTTKTSLSAIKAIVSSSKALISCTGLGVASVWTFFLLENVAR